MDFATALMFAEMGRKIIDSVLLNVQANQGFTSEQKQQILDIAGRSDDAFDQAVASAQARLNAGG